MHIPRPTLVSYPNYFHHWGKHIFHVHVQSGNETGATLPLLPCTLGKISRLHEQTEKPRLIITG